MSVPSGSIGSRAVLQKQGPAGIETVDSRMYREGPILAGAGMGLAAKILGWAWARLKAGLTKGQAAPAPASEQLYRDILRMELREMYVRQNYISTWIVWSSPSQRFAEKS